MRFIRVGSVLLGTVALVLIAVGLALITLDLGRFKGIIVDLASDTLQREVAIDGALSITVGEKIHVSATGIRVTSESWTEVPNLVTVDSAEITIDSWMLIQGTALIDDVRASGVRAHLVLDDAGNNNWTFTGLATETGELTQPSSTDNSETIPVILKQVEILDARLSYQDPGLPIIEMTATRLSLREDAKGTLDFDLAGTLNDEPLVITGNLGVLDNLIETKDVRFAVTADIGEITLNGSGWIDDLTAPRKPELELSIQGPKAEYLTDLLDVEPVTTGPMAFNATVSEQENGVVIAVQGRFGEFDLSLNAQLQDLLTQDDLDVTLSAQGPNLSAIGKAAGQSGFPEQPFTIDAALTFQDGSLTVEEFLFDVGPGKLMATASFPNFPSPEDAQARLNASGPDFGDFNRLLGLPGILKGTFEITASLDSTATGGDINARLQADAIEASLEGTFSDHPELVGTRATVAVKGDDASIIAAAFDVAGVPAEPFSAYANLTLQTAIIEIASGVLTFGPETVTLAGALGREDPLSIETRLHLSSQIEDLNNTLQRFGLVTEQMPAGVLALTAEIGRDDNAYLLDSLTLKHSDVDIRIDGSLGDSLALSDLGLNFEITGRELSTLIPVAEGMLAKEVFHSTGRIGFRGDETLLLDDLQATYGAATASVSASLSIVDSGQVGELSITAQAPHLAEILPGMEEYLTTDDAFKLTGGGRWQADGIWLEDTSIELGDADIRVRGELHTPPLISGTALTVDASLPDLAALERLVEPLMPEGAMPEGAMPEGALSFHGELLAEGDEFRMSDFSLKLGENDLAGSLTFRPPANDKVAKFTADLQSRYLDLRSLQNSLATEPTDTAAVTDDGHLIPDTPVPLELLQALDATVAFSGERMRLEIGDLRDVRLSASLDAGALLVDEFALTGDYGGSLTGALELKLAGDGADLHFEMDGTNLILGLPAESDEDKRLLPKYEISTRLAASGATARELAASSRGYVRIVSDEGKIALGGVSFLMRDFAAEVFNSINPLAKKETHSQVQCLAVLVEINDGLVEGNPAVVFQTDKLNITGVGRVDLGSEKLNAKFHTTARKGIGIGVSDLVSPMTEVGGTLGSPRLQLNTAGTVVRGSALVATVGLSFVANKMRTRWFSDKNPCRTAIADADKDLTEGRVPLSGPPP